MKSEELLVDPKCQPSPEMLEEWLGKRGYGYWTYLSGWITHNYPGIFSPDWLCGGMKYGWFLRYKKSKSFCQFFPKRKKFGVVIVFGAKERDEVEKIKSELSLPTKTEYENAKTLPDGKWVYLMVTNKTVVTDIQKFLSIKRKIRRPNNS